MKKYSLLFVLLLSILFLSSTALAAKHFTLDEGLAKVAEKIGTSSRVSGKANLAVVGFVESTRGECACRLVVY